jgi:hypothetical protein
MSTKPSKLIALRIPLDLYEMISQKAKEEDRSISNYIKKTLRQEFIEQKLRDLPEDSVPISLVEEEKIRISREQILKGKSVAGTADELIAHMHKSLED